MKRKKKKPQLNSAYYEAYLEVDLTMKFWREIGLMTTGDAAVRGQAWNFFSVSSCHSFEMVDGVLPGYLSSRLNYFIFT